MSSTKNEELERIYTVPLSRAWIAPRHRRTKRAVNILREFAVRHMKSSEIKIETALNETMWVRGITSPPRRIIVRMKKDEDGVVTISLPKEEKGQREVTPEGEEVPQQNEATAVDADKQQSQTVKGGNSIPSPSSVVKPGGKEEPEATKGGASSPQQQKSPKKRSKS